MKYEDGSLRLSASDLVGHLHCDHLTAMDVAAADGEVSRPAIWDPVLDTLIQRGREHERRYVHHLRQSGIEVVEIEGTAVTAAHVEQTLKAMRSGAEVIVQGALERGIWGGRADVLRRREIPSDLGAWSYEVIDTKLARETKGATVLQLSLYSDLLATLQGHAPEHMYVVTPGSGYEPEVYRVGAFGAYYRQVKAQFEGFLAKEGEKSTYPEPNAHCELCAWRTPCDSRRRQDDHLCLVAGITQVQTQELRAHGVATLQALAHMPLPLNWKPDRGLPTSYERIREQARIQLQGRIEGKPLHEILPIVEKFGLSALPLPSPGDMFFDLEGDPFVDEGGLEYLFGYVFEEGSTHYREHWSMSRAEEKRAFEAFVDFVMARWQRFPDMHIYHYAPYEPSALKRLMGRYASREEEIDRMLRGGLFIDLYQIVRLAIRASVESYSIKKLEPLFGFVRSTPLDEASRALASVQTCLELADPGGVSDTVKAIVAGYNREDCLAAQELRSWLEALRAQLRAAGTTIGRPAPADAEVSEELTAWQQRVEALISRLTEGLPLDPKERSAEQQARWILAHTLDWHRREEKALWWEYFRLSGLSAEELLDERPALSGLSFIGNAGGTVKAPVHRYRFPAQEAELRGGEDLHDVGGAKLGKLMAISLDEHTFEVKKRGDSANTHPAAVFAHTIINTKVLAEALLRIAEDVADHGLHGIGDFVAARALLMRSPPQVGGEALSLPGESGLESAVRLALAIQQSVLPIQGPPGTGKTHVGARMIAHLVKAGKRVGITATSHTVIRRLLEESVRAGEEIAVDLRCIQKTDQYEDSDQIICTEDNAEVFSALASNRQVAAGTAWLWARPEASDSVDVLFVDEAAQMSLANVLAVSQAAPMLVLLGDPQQLDQPTKGSHPEGTGISALTHILHGQQTISADRGLFLADTWRLNPEICSFTSELFYEGRLHPVKGLELQTVRSGSRLKGSGLRYLPVEHSGNQNSSPEETLAISKLVSELLGASSSWIDRMGIERVLTLEDILIIAPYNAQVFDLKEAIPGARVGTVDKFQGQEAPVVIYSMTSSSYADAPRGMNFLYSLNRLNVATSRARCLCVLVSSPSIFEPECRVPEHMQMANAFCRYLELAAPW